MIDTPAWQALHAHYQRIAPIAMRTMFAEQAQRFDHFALRTCGLLLDYSKNRITEQTIALLIALARQQNVEQQRDAMFAGVAINRTENRAVLHTALRDPARVPLIVDGQNIRDAIHDTLKRMEEFVDQVRSGAWTGYSGRAITHIVHIGIGGSDLGPRMVCQALSMLRHERLKVQFVANVDAHELGEMLRELDPASTLFIIASKTFTTLETIMNAQMARSWCMAGGIPEHQLQRHFVAVSANAQAVEQFGIAVKNSFPCWDWVGGRFSLWSAIGLPIALQCGMAHFRQLLAGAHAMDQHFRNAPLESNMPILLALIGIWNTNILGNGTLSIAPYHALLKKLPAHLQQLEMESNGKSTSIDGQGLAYCVAPIVWGQVGTNGQHAYFQWLHQGSAWTAVDFIGVVQGYKGYSANDPHQNVLLANCLAQSQALMQGKTLAEARLELQAQGLSPEQIEYLAPHKVFPGNRPSNTILLPRLDPFHLGALLALYEHKVMVQGVLWGINSFDQWGVEWGKVLAQTIRTSLLASTPLDAQKADASTCGLIQAIREMRDS